MFLTGVILAYVQFISSEYIDSISAQTSLLGKTNTHLFHNNMFNIDLYSIYGGFFHAS
jgi:hypothetical protein